MFHKIKLKMNGRNVRDMSQPYAAYILHMETLLQLLQGSPKDKSLVREIRQ